MPRVSIILPTKNSMRFLGERVESIKAQAFSDFEVIALDTASTDGTREYLSKWAAEDPRVKVRDVPPGVYRALNAGIAMASGTFVYFAMSDDTMRPDALEKMVAALDRNPDCGICDSRLVEIDDGGNVLEDGDALHLECFRHLFFDRTKGCIRRPPFDFYLHCCGRTVYTSLTQILVRKRVFDVCGGFPEDRGPSADFYWGMKCAMTQSVVYLPDELATWRLHGEQLTGHDFSYRNFTLTCEMIDDVLAQPMDEEIRAVARKLSGIVHFKATLLPVKRGGTALQKAAGLAKGVLLYPRFSACFFVLAIRARFFRRESRPEIAAYCELFYRLLRKHALESLLHEHA